MDDSPLSALKSRSFMIQVRVNSHTTMYENVQKGTERDGGNKRELIECEIWAPNYKHRGEFWREKEQSKGYAVVGHTIT